MSERTANTAGPQLTLDLWHPDCWAIEATDRTGGGILAHAIYDAPQMRADGETVTGLFTAYGDTESEVETLIETVRGSSLAGEVLKLQRRFGQPNHASVPGNVSCEFFLEYDPGDMICPTLLSHGFVHNAPARIEGGREYWSVCYAGDREEIQPCLDAIEDETGADVSVASITAYSTGPSERHRRADILTENQRKAFELARERGYYEWPREVSTRELAEELGVSKTTLLEHLRKAESKLLDPDS